MNYKYLDKFFNQSELFYIACSSSGNIIDANKAICELLECSQQDLLRDGAFPFLHPDDVESSKDLFLNVFAQKLPSERITHRVI